MKVYKYRANLFNEKEKRRRDTESLLKNEFYAAKFKELNDPFECSFDLQMKDSDKTTFYNSINPLDVGIYSLGMLQQEELFPSHELMWAHYANSHKGFCIEYDLDKMLQSSYPDFDIRNKITVIYQPNMPTIVKEDFNDIFGIQKKVFGTKSLAWEYENEIRLVFLESGIKHYSQEIVTGIYFGLNIGLEEWNLIINKLKRKNIKFYQINRTNNSYKLSCSELNESDIYNYQIISQSSNMIVDNYNVLYLGVNKDKITMQNFVNEFRRGKYKPTNITIYDDLRVEKCINKWSSQTTEEEKQILAKHWITYAPFDIAPIIWMYPES